jgi:hypothetical protein
MHVLDAGAEPRRSLRVHPAVGVGRTVDFVLTTSTHVLGEAAARVRRPHIATKTRVVGAVTVTSSDDAVSTWRFQVTSAEALPFEGMSEEFVSGVAHSVAPARGASGTFSLPVGGGLGALDVDTRSLDAAASAARTKIVRLIAMSLAPSRPRQPVGAGARWTIETEEAGTTDCALGGGDEPVVRCHGGLAVPPEARDSVQGVVETEVVFDAETGLAKHLVARSVIHMVAPEPGHDSLMEMETRSESRLEVR